MSGAADRLGAAVERAMIGAAVDLLDRRAGALRDSGGDPATVAHRARMAEALEAAAADVQALLGPISPNPSLPAQGRLALAEAP